MNQGLDIGGTAKQLVDAVHDGVVALGIAPVPTIIIVGLLAMFALVGSVVGGQARDRTPRHSHRH